MARLTLEWLPALGGREQHLLCRDGTPLLLLRKGGRDWVLHLDPLGQRPFLGGLAWWQAVKVAHVLGDAADRSGRDFDWPVVGEVLDAMLPRWRHDHRVGPHAARQEVRA